MIASKDARVGKHGLKTALLTRQGHRVYSTAADPCETAFEPSTMDDNSTSRLNVDLRGSEDMIAFFDQIDVEAPLHFAAVSEVLWQAARRRRRQGLVYSVCEAQRRVSRDAAHKAPAGRPYPHPLLGR